MNGGEIKNVLTLDVSKFDSAIKKATAQLDKLDTRLEKVGKVADKLDKGVSALASELGSATGNFQILDRVVGNIGNHLNAARSGVEKVGKASKKAKGELEQLAGSAEKLESMADWTAHYGKALDGLNPKLSKVTKTQSVLEKAVDSYAKTSQKSELQIAQTRAKSLAAERTSNQAKIAARQKMMDELQRIEKQAQEKAQSIQSAANKKFFGKNSTSPKRAAMLTEAGAFAADASAAAEQSRAIRDSVRALTNRNVELRSGIVSSMREVQLLREAEALDAARLQHQRNMARAVKDHRQEQDRQRNANAKTDQRVGGIISNATVPGWSARDSAGVFVREFAAQQAASAKQSDEQKRLWTKYWQDYSKYAEDSAKQAAPRVAKAMEQFTKPGWSARDSASVFQAHFDEEIRQHKRVEKERKRIARETAAYERQEAMATAQMWKGIGAMWAASKASQLAGKGINSASEFQQTDVRLKMFNMPEGEYEQFKRSSMDLARKTPGMSMDESMKLRMDGMSALGHNDPAVLDALMPKASKAALGLKMAGYDNNDTSTIMKNLFGVIEMRQQQYDPEAAKRTIDMMVQAVVASNGKISLQDVETFFRNGGAGVRQIGDDGLRNIIPLLEMFKTAGGGSGGGSGVARVGNSIKMFQAYANGKPLTNKGVEQLLGAGVMNNEFESMTLENFKKSQKANIALMKALKTNGLKDSDLLMDNPVEFLNQLRAPVLKYMTDPKNINKFFQGVEDFSYDEKGQMVRKSDGKVVDKVQQANIEGGALQKFFASMGMSQGAIDAMTTSMNIIAQQRAQHVSEQQKTAGGADQIYDQSLKTWAGSMQELQTAGKNLAVALTPVLEGMTKLVNIISYGVSAVANFVGGSGFGQVIGVLGAATLAVATFNMTIGTAWRALRGASEAANSLKVIEAAALGGGTALDGFAGGAGRAGKGAKGAGDHIGNLSEKSADATTKTNGLLSKVTQSGVAMKAMSGLTSGLSMGMTLLGGPIGAISTLLIVGASLWEAWGSKARKALNDAKASAQGAEAYILQAQNEKTYGVGQAGTFKAQRAAAYKEFAESRAKTQADFDKVGVGADTEGGAFVGSRKQLLGAARKAAAARNPAGRVNAPMTEREMELEKSIKSLDKAISIATERDAEAVTPVTLAKVPTKGATGQVNPKDLEAGGKGGKGGAARAKREFQDAFQIKLSQFQQDAKLLDLETQGILSGQANYQARAEEQFIKAWMTGQFDNGKDPQNRPFVKGGAKYDAKRGWNVSDIDMTGTAAQDFLEAVKKKLEAQDINAAVSLGKGKLEAASEDVATALAQLATESYGGSEALDALRREFARFEGTHPGAVGDAGYQSVKRGSLTNAAASDALKLSKGYREGFFEKNLQLNSGMSDAQKQVLTAQHTADIEEKRMKAAEDSLRQQIKEEEEKGNTSTKAYANALAALWEIEDSFGKQREIVKKMVEESKKTAVQKTMESWGRTEDRYNDMASGWLNNISSTLKGQITGTDRINVRAFGGTVAGDLAGMFMNKALSQASTGMFGSTSFYSQAGSLMDGTGIKGGGWLGDKLNKWRGLDENGEGEALDLGSTVSNMFDDLAGSLGTFGESLKGIMGGFDGLGDSLLGGIRSIGEFSWSLITKAVTAIGQFVTSLLSASASSGGSGGFLGAIVGGIAGVFGGGAAAGATGAGTMDALTDLGVFANGGSFGKSGLHAFANGGAFTNGIYNSPTLFKFANGGGFNNGVMGEAGPEAVMPLSRDGSGRLGVQVQGGMADSGTNVAITINVNQDGSSAGGDSSSGTGDNAEVWKTMAGRVKGLVVQEIVNQKRPGGALWK